MIIIKSNHELPKYEIENNQATSIALEDDQGNLIISIIYSRTKHKIIQTQYEQYIKAWVHGLLLEETIMLRIMNREIYNTVSIEI